MGKFKVGDRVTLQKSSQHYGCGFSNPKDTLGIIIITELNGKIDMRTLMEKATSCHYHLLNLK